MVYTLILYSFIHGSIRKFSNPVIPTWTHNNALSVEPSIRQVSFYWNARESPIDLENPDHQEECNICFENYLKELKPEYSCKCAQKQICHRCILRQVVVNRTCPWCRETISEIHIKMI
jgi:hypothetical protein